MEYTLTYKPRTAAQVVVTLAQAKANARIEYNDEDALLQLYVDAVTDEIEKITGTIVLERKVVVGFPRFKHHFKIPVYPVTAVDSVKYYDKNGDLKTVNPENYQFITGELGNQIVTFKNFDFPTTEADNAYPVLIEVTCGYTTATMPADIKRAALLMFGSAETYREDMPLKLNRSAYNILKHYKNY